jgi:hypothetical protein
MPHTITSSKFANPNISFFFGFISQLMSFLHELHLGIVLHIFITSNFEIHYQQGELIKPSCYFDIDFVRYIESITSTIVFVFLLGVLD